MRTREPAVAGMFYPADKTKINLLINKILYETNIDCIKKYLGRKIIGGVVPHAGYEYSGSEAICFFELLKKSAQKFDTVVILNPNHTGLGKMISIDENEFWETPLGKLEIDRELGELCGFEKCSNAHYKEHSAEVMLPFLQHFINFDFKIMPVTLSAQNIETAKLTAARIYNAIEKSNRKIIIIASSDFSHYVNPQKGEKTDMQVIKLIEELNSEKLIKKVISENISMCGFGPVAALIEYTKKVSDKAEIKLLKFGNSAKKRSSPTVVDYASMLAFE